MTIAAIMPCRGRLEQTAANVKRLLATAGYDDWRLYPVGAVDEERIIVQLMLEFKNDPRVDARLEEDRPRLTYWQALAALTPHIGASLLINLANDLLPGHQWLLRGVEAYRQLFGSGDGMIGFNDGHHEVGHSCHFLISRGLLERYGGWPTWYDHNFGDTELCQRAIADGLYAKAPWAVLYHDHPYFGGQDDAVYAEGRAMFDQDRRLFEQRRRRGWT